MNPRRRPGWGRPYWLPAILPLLPLLAAAVPAETRWPGPAWDRARPADLGLDATTLTAARDAALTGGGSGIVVRHGRVALSWGDPKQTYDLKSSTKAIGVTALGLALADGKIRSLHEPAPRYHPDLGVPPEANRDTRWIETITLWHLATQTAGFDKPGGYGPLLFEPGTQWSYSDAGPNWLAECLTLLYRRDLQDLLFERICAPLGITRRDLRWRDNAYRPHTLAGVARREFGSGIHANVGAMARIGLLYLHRGRWRDQQLLPAWFVDAARTTPYGLRGLPVRLPSQYGRASDHYGLLWWNNADGSLPGVPRDAFWSWGLHDSLIVVVPSLDLVAARAGRSLASGRDARYDRIAPFLTALARSVRDRGPWSGAPVPRSEVIRSVRWAPAETIRRAAQGSDNWPLTWADDDHLYTAYGDGWGFAPCTEVKLSLGLARIEGGPSDFRGVNIRSQTGEQRGGGAAGLKASGLLCVDGVLYLWARNAANARLFWSADHARTWQACDWRFRTSFGAPTFLNAGRDNAHARDAFVYVYSPDSDTAYDPADRMVLARVPRNRIRDPNAYRFFGGLNAQGQPHWTPALDDRQAVFVNPGACYRSGITYNPGLGRYLWCQTLPFSRDPRGPRFQGGFGIYEAPEPWGPWRTVFYTEDWDVGPGESACLPVKWMSPDGRTAHLVFSGDDGFSVRRVTFE